MQTSLFGQPMPKKAHFLVFHDESEPVPNKGWLLIGLLFIRQNDQDYVESVLRYHRQRENYWGEIHFCDLPKSFDGAYGAKARVARRWMRTYQDELCQHVFFTCLAVNRASPKFEHKRFAHDYHAYNRFTAMAIKAGVSYLLAPLGYDEIILTLVSDEKDRKSRPEQGFVDNFEEYVPYRVELDSRSTQRDNPQYRAVSMKSIQTFPSQQSDLLQLTDLLLGAIQAALIGLSTRPVKRELGRMVVSWYRDLQKPPWQQKYQMHRKFDFWGFPDEKGMPFHTFPMKIEEYPDQPSLF